jgi:arsenical pump membrane protein
MIFAIAGATFVAILTRPFRLGEAWWAVGGALALIAFDFLPVREALAAMGRGADVYLFLLGMLVLAEILRTQGVFERLAEHALRISGASQTKLFALVFGVGAGVTVFFSNDATAVVLTRAVATVLGRTRVSAYPYLFACAFVANAASFVLPISNPANLVVFGGALPRLGPWLGAFVLPSMAALAATYGVLAFAHRSRLRAPLRFDGASARLPSASRGERVASVACAVAAAGMAAASLAGAPLGAATFGLALAALAAVSFADRTAARKVLPHLNYAIVPLVAALFTIVAALDRAGLLSLVREGFGHAQGLGAPLSSLVAGGAVAVACNAINNLPVALGVASAFDAHTSVTMRHAALVAVDLGPNLAISGSLATFLWMDALRRERIAMDAPRFLRNGAAVALPALVVALLAVR